MYLFANKSNLCRYPFKFFLIACNLLGFFLPLITTFLAKVHDGMFSINAFQTIKEIDVGREKGEVSV